MRRTSRGLLLEAFGQWADAQVREVTTEEMAERFQLTPEEFRRKLYSHARWEGLEVKSHKTAGGMQFCLGRYQDVKDKAVSVHGRRAVHKPELKPKIVAFIQEKRAASSADIGREFFNGDGHQTRRYLTALDEEGRITSTRRGKYLWWSPAGVEVTDGDLSARTPKPVGRPGPRPTREAQRAATRARRSRAHGSCLHPATPAARKKCRAGKEPVSKATLRATAKADEIAELAMTEKWLSQFEEQAQTAAPEYGVSSIPDEPDGMAEIRARQAIRRKKSVERLKAEGKFHGWREHGGYENYRMGGGPTVYALAHFIHVRMKNDRRHKGWYRFTYEWVKSHYPHLLANYRNLVEDALELLVIQGKIERLDYPVKVAVSGI